MKIIAILCMLIVGCNSYPKEGTVTQKEIVAAHDWIWLMPTIHSDGKMTYTTFVPIPMHDPEAYVIQLQKDTIRWTRYVSYARYKCLSIGDHFIDSIDCSDIPIGRRRK